MVSKKLLSHLRCPVVSATCKKMHTMISWRPCSRQCSNAMERVSSMTMRYVVSKLGFQFTMNSYKHSTKIQHALLYLRLHASCRPSSGLKSRVWPLRLLVLFTVIARPERRFHNHLLRSEAWIIGQPNVSSASLQKCNGTARYVELLTNKEAESLVLIAEAQACGATS